MTSGIYRNIVFTVFNYNESDIDIFKNCELIKYCIIGKEICPKTGTKHLQGYAELTKQLRFNVIKTIHTGMHFEARKGTQKQAIDYCKKDGNFIELGVSKKQGARTDLEQLRDKIKTGYSIAQLIEDEAPCLLKIRTAEKYMTYVGIDRTWQMECIWCYGASGSGKTKWAYDNFKDSLYIKDNTKWWDGYDGQETILIDDFRASKWDFDDLLRLMDRYPMRVQIKGGYRNIVSRRIIFTNVNDPDTEFAITAISEDLKQFGRRLTKLKLFQDGRCAEDLKNNLCAGVTKEGVTEVEEGYSKPPQLNVTELNSIITELREKYFDECNLAYYNNTECNRQIIKQLKKDIGYYRSLLKNINT